MFIKLKTKYHYQKSSNYFRKIIMPTWNYKMKTYQKA